MQRGKMRIIYILLILIAIAAAIYGYYYYSFPNIELNITNSTTVSTTIPSGQAVLSRGIYGNLQSMIQWFSNLIYSR